MKKLLFLAFIGASLCSCAPASVVPGTSGVYLICKTWGKNIDPDSGSAPTIYKINLNEDKGFASLRYGDGPAQALVAAFDKEQVALVQKEEKNTYFEFRGSFIPVRGGDEWQFTIDKKTGEFLVRKKRGAAFVESAEAKGYCSADK